MITYRLPKKIYPFKDKIGDAGKPSGDDLSEEKPSNIAYLF